LQRGIDTFLYLLPLILLGLQQKLFFKLFNRRFLQYFVSWITAGYCQFTLFERTNTVDFIRRFVFGTAARNDIPIRTMGICNHKYFGVCHQHPGHWVFFVQPAP
jgi:hypothetical protein